MSKNKRFIKLVSVMLVCIMVMVMCMGAYGGTAFKKGEDVNLLNSLSDPIEAVVEAQVIYFGSSLEQDENKIIIAKQKIEVEEREMRSPDYLYQNTVYPEREVIIVGFAGNQLPGGYRFPTGGAFYYSKAGGPTASVGISVSLPAPFNFISVSTNLGISAGAGFGTIVNVPNTTDFFKLEVTKYLKVIPYASYRKPINAPSSTEWELWNTGLLSSTDDRESAVAVKVS